MSKKIHTSGRRAAVLLILSLVPFTGCDRESGPIDAGRYDYRAAHAAPGGEDTIRIQGVLAVQEVHGDTLEGHWEVPQLHPELRVLEDAEGEMVVMAQPTYFGTIYHRISRSGRGISCAAEYVWVAEGGVERSVPVSCSITRDPGATPRPAGAPPEGPMVRPAQDTMFE